MSDSSPTPADSADVATSRVAPPSERLEEGAQAGELLGRYVVLEQIGRGGMGSVMRAYDPKLQREVALKVVLPEARDDEASARMVREARAMAKLSHPNVVAVYDAEIADRGVVLVMEYVDGQTLRDWTRAGSHPWPEILGRFLDAGRGLAAAHAEGLLHRDFKPANVLVADSGAVKVTDFGLAKTADGSGVSNSIGASNTGPASRSGDSSRSSLDGELTDAGAVLGTPRYMSPEQHAGAPLDSATDQYNFCVALWEGLAGDPPFAGPRLAADKRKGPPAWSGPKAVPSMIVDAMRRGLAVDPSERWETMEALLSALAWDPARRRRRLAVVATTLGGITLSAVAVASWSSAQSARCSGAEEQLAGVWDDGRRSAADAAFQASELSYAPDVWARIGPSVDAYAQAWKDMHTEACEATAIHGQQSAEVMDLRMGCLHRAKLELELAAEILADADAKVVQRAHRLVDGLPALSRCADIETLRAEVDPPAPEEEERVSAVDGLLANSRVYRRASRYDKAQAAFDEAESLAAELQHVPTRTQITLERGFILEGTGEYEASAEAFKAALKMAATGWNRAPMREAAAQLLFIVGYFQQKPDEAMHYRALAEGLSGGNPIWQARIHSNLGAIFYVQGDYSKSEIEQRAALTLREGARGPEHPTVAASRNNLAAALEAQGKYAEAEAEYREAMRIHAIAGGPQHPNVGTSQNNLANALQSQGRYPEAEAEFRSAIAMISSALGPEHPDVGMLRNNLGNTLSAQGRFAEAEKEHRRGLAIRKTTLGTTHPDVAASHTNLGAALHGQGRFEDAEAEHRAAMAIAKVSLGADHPDVAAEHNNLGIALSSQEKFAEAEIEHRAGMELAARVFGADHPTVATYRTNLAAVLGAQGEQDAAEAEFRTALDAFAKSLGREHPEVGRAARDLADLLLVRGRAGEALALAEQAWAAHQRDDIPAARRAQTAFVLARALDAVGGGKSARRARTLADRAARDFADAGEQHAAQRREVQDWSKIRDR